MTSFYQNWLRRVVERSPAVAAFVRELRQDWHWRRKTAVQTPYRFWFVGDPTMEDGTFEPEETRLLLRMLIDRDVLIDIGANVGYYTCLALSQGKKVVAFEPLPQNLLILFRNLEENGWCDTEVWPIGLGEGPGVLPIFGAHTGASLVPGWGGVSKSWKQFIAVNSLDCILAHRLLGKKMVIKIDVEGAEFGVLRGAIQLLRRDPKPVWLVEIMLTLHRPDPNPHFLDIFDIFWENGYEALTGDGSNRVVLRADVARWLKLGKCDFGTHNWLFISR